MGVDLLGAEEKGKSKRQPTAIEVRESDTIQTTSANLDDRYVYLLHCLITCRFDTRKFFKNPVYEGTDPKQLEESLTPEQKKFQKNKYDRIVVVPSQQTNGQKYDVLNRKETLPSEYMCMSLLLYDTIHVYTYTHLL